MNRIKFRLLLLFLSIIGVTMMSCAKKDIYVDLTANSWKVVKMKKPGESSYKKAEKSYMLTFTSEQTYTLELDVNNCFGDYNVTSNGNIDLGQGGCTEICCDSDFGVDILKLLPKMAKYYGKGDELILEGEGKIILKKE